MITEMTKVKDHELIAYLALRLFTLEQSESIFAEQWKLNAKLEIS